MKYDVQMARKLGGQIFRRRKLLGLTQAKAAERADCGTTYFGRIERGERTPSIEKLFTIAGALEATPSDLLIDCAAGVDRDLLRTRIKEMADQVKEIVDEL